MHCVRVLWNVDPLALQMLITEAFGVEIGVLWHATLIKVQRVQ